MAVNIDKVCDNENYPNSYLLKYIKSWGFHWNWWLCQKFGPTRASGDGGSSQTTRLPNSPPKTHKKLPKFRLSILLITSWSSFGSSVWVLCGVSPGQGASSDTKSGGAGGAGRPPPSQNLLTHKWNSQWVARTVLPSQRIDQHCLGGCWRYCTHTTLHACCSTHCTLHAWYCTHYTHA